jgi:hypothetical protein
LDLQDFYYTRAARTLGKNAVQANLLARAKRLKNMEPVTWTPVRNDPLPNVAEERYYLETECQSRVILDYGFITFPPYEQRLYEFWVQVLAILSSSKTDCCVTCSALRRKPWDETIM